jgi:hypothetical protein
MKKSSAPQVGTPHRRCRLAERHAIHVDRQQQVDVGRAAGAAVPPYALHFAASVIER